MSNLTQNFLLCNVSSLRRNISLIPCLGFHHSYRFRRDMNALFSGNPASLFYQDYVDEM